MKRVRALFTSDLSMALAIVVFAGAVVASVLWILGALESRDRVRRLQSPTKEERVARILLDVDACLDDDECRRVVRMFLDDLSPHDREATRRRARRRVAPAGVADHRRDATRRPPPRPQATRRADRRDASPKPGRRPDRPRGRVPSPGPDPPRRPPAPDPPPDERPLVDLTAPLLPTVCTQLVGVNC